MVDPASLPFEQRLGALLIYLATSDRDKAAVQLALELETDPSETIGRILHHGRKYLGPAMMPGYRRQGSIKNRLGSGR
jgi:hypothetical protein